MKGLEGNQGQICEIKYSDIALYVLTGISCTCSHKCSFFPPISPSTLALFTLFSMLPCAGAGSILDFTQQLGFHSPQFSLVAIMAMLHLIWSHQKVFQQHYLQILGSDSNVHESAWVQRITAQIFHQPVFANLEIPAQEQVRLVMQDAHGLGLAGANNFAIDNQAPRWSLLSPSSVRHVVDGFKFAIKPNQYGFLRILAPREVLCLQAVAIYVGLFIILIVGIHW